MPYLSSHHTKGDPGRFPFALQNQDVRPRPRRVLNPLPPFRDAHQAPQSAYTEEVEGHDPSNVEPVFQEACLAFRHGRDFSPGTSLIP